MTSYRQIYKMPKNTNLSILQPLKASEPNLLCFLTLVLENFGIVQNFCSEMAPNGDVSHEIVSGIIWEIMEKSTQSTNFFKKKVNFFKLGTYLMKRSRLFFNFCANFHAWTLCNNKVTEYWPLQLEHYINFVLIL